MNRRDDLLEKGPVANRDAFGGWILLALGISLLIHFFFWSWSRDFKIDRMSDSFYEKIVPRTFQVERVDIDPRLLEPEKAETQIIKTTPIALPEETISLEKEIATVPDAKQPPRLDKSLLAEKPILSADSRRETAPTTKPSRELMPSDNALTEELLREMPAIANNQMDVPSPLIPALGEMGADSTTPDAGKGFTDLDKLLAQTGPLTAETAPILLPGDLLFDYDSHELHPGALSSLEKLGILLKRNPRAHFVIEGHTDSFGPDDYNMGLSQRRAESVKAWLIQNISVPADSISTRGFGKTRLVAPSQGTIDEQKINRRVEIVIQDSKR
jgi:outer membrane protein OmpA-like peptidoglycan-associated protein